MDWKALFLDPKGRIGRKDFWIGFAVLFVAGIVLGMIPVIGQIVGLLMLYFWVCLGSKRLHDMGKSGWLMIVPFALQVVGMVVALLAVGAMSGGAGDDAAAAAALGGGGLIAMLAGLVSLAFLIWIGASPGQPEANQYGPPPAQPVTAS